MHKELITWQTNYALLKCWPQL